MHCCGSQVAMLLGTHIRNGRQVSNSGAHTLTDAASKAAALLALKLT
jgi:hypothetical protein